MQTVIAQQHLAALAAALDEAGWSVRPVSGTQPRIRVINPDHPLLHETIACRPADDGVPYFWWSWGLPISPTDDVDMAVRRIRHVLRTVADRPDDAG